MLVEIEAEVEFYYFCYEIPLRDCPKFCCISEQYEFFEVDDIQIAFLLLLLLWKTSLAPISESLSTVLWLI